MAIPQEEVAVVKSRRQTKTKRIEREREKDRVERGREKKRTMGKRTM